MEILVPRSARTTEATLASSYLNANTRAVFLVPLIIRAAQDAVKRVDSVVVIAHATCDVGNPAPRVRKHVNGAVHITPVLWRADR